jgi:predicted Rossmann-fold nucleotide-binding protein
MNEPRENSSSRNFTSLRWVLVVGTGIPRELKASEHLAARAIGKSLAQYQYGLISGGWPGVDEIVTKSYIDELRSKKFKSGQLSDSGCR